MRRWRIGFLIALACVCAAAFGKDGPYRPPRLHDGRVDLQGNWTRASITRLERPDRFQSLVITPQEAEQEIRRYIAVAEDPSTPGDTPFAFDPVTIDSIGGKLRSSMIVEPRNGKIPGNAVFFSTVAQQRAVENAGFDGPEQRSNFERCLASVGSAPPYQSLPSNNLRQIVQTSDTIVIAAESMHEARVIRLNSEHVPAAVTSWLGDAIGWWEGDTLVVETKYFASSSQYRSSRTSALLVSPRTTMIERFTRVSRDRLRYEFTVEDPSYYTRPWSGETLFHRTDDRIFEYACHEGNYALPFILQAARREEATIKLVQQMRSVDLPVRYPNQTAIRNR